MQTWPVDPHLVMPMQRIFDTTRVPGKECDKLVHYEDVQKYVAVTRKGVWYKLYMTTMGVNGKMRYLLPHEIEIQIEHIIKNADQYPAKEDEAFAAFTGWNRTR